MFKDLYKKANDSIETDEAYKRLMQRLETEKPENPYMKVYKTVAAVAACAAVAAVTGIYTHIMNDRDFKNVASVTQTAQPIQKTPSSHSSGNKEINTDISADSAEKINKPQPIQKNTPAVTAKKQSAAPKPEEKEEAAVNSDAQQQATAIPTQMPSAAPLPTEKAEERNMTIAMNINEVSRKTRVSSSDMNEESMPETNELMNYSLAGGSGGSGNAPEEVTLQEYYNYLGKNIEEMLTLPQQLENDTEKTQYFEKDEQGNYINDNWIFMYSNEDKRIEIETTKNTEAVQSMLDDGNYKKSTVYGENTVVIKNDGIYTAYIIKDNIAFTLTCCDITQAELQNLLVSIAQ